MSIMSGINALHCLDVLLDLIGDLAEFVLSLPDQTQDRLPDVDRHFGLAANPFAYRAIAYAKRLSHLSAPLLSAP